jgi:hypothetical protein
LNRRDSCNKKEKSYEGIEIRVSPLQAASGL